MTADVTVHRLGFALRVEDHFSIMPVPEELEVSIDTGHGVVATALGRTRHDDGTYRWIDLGDGLHRLTIRSGSGRWRRWTVDPIEVFVPLLDPQVPVRVEMWPTPMMDVPGVPAIRGKLVGTGVAGLRVEIDGTGTTAPTGRWTRADDFGELLFPFPGGPWPMTADGALDLTAVVPGRTVTSVDVLPDLASFGGAQFHIASDRISRVRFHVT